MIASAYDHRRDVENYIEGVCSGEIVTGRLVRLAVERHVADLEHAIKRGFYFDDLAAEAACQFFPELLVHSIGRWDKEPFELSPWQKFCMWCIFGWKEIDTRRRRFLKAFISIARKNGKGLELETPIPTPSGWTTMGDIRVGDVLFDDNGLPCSVTYVSDDRNIDCYRVHFSNGESVVCDGDHLWTTRARVSRPAVQVRNVRSLRDTLRDGKGANHSLDMPQPIQCAAAVLPIDPYALGAWLGDGDTDAARFTCSRLDTEIVEAIRGAGLKVTASNHPSEVAKGGLAVRYKIQKPKGDTCPRGHAASHRNARGRCKVCERDGERSRKYGTDRAPVLFVKSFREELRLAGVLGNKHIPAQYLRASFSQRLALLQGLMDTDGYINKNGTVINFDTTCEALRDGVAELLASFGLKFTIIKRAMRCNRRDVEGHSYRFQFCAFRDDLPVFRLQRKLDRMKVARSSSSRSRTVQIVAVDPIPSVTTRCIQVSSPSHQFLCGRTMLPTHNTTFAAGIPILCMYCDDPPEPGAELYCCATKEEQALKLWRETERMIRKSPQLRALTKFRHKRIIFEELDSFFTPLGSDSDSTDGLNPHVVVKDELHAWQERHRGLHGKLSTGSGAREQPLEIIITTAGDDRSTIWIEEDDFARRVVEGPINGDIIDDRLFAFVARIDDDDNPFDEEVWIKANPNLEVSVFTEKLRIFANTAQQDPSKYSDFVRYYCNRRVTSSERAVKAELWAEAKGVRPDPARFDRTYIHAGFDLGRADDFAAVATCEAFHKEDELPKYFIRSRSFTCKDSPMMEREQIRGFVREDLIELHDGNSVDFNDVQRFILDWAEDYNPATWAYDETFAKQMAQSLLNEHGLQIFKFTQAPTFYNEPVREFLKALADGRIIHEGDPVLTWQALNLTIKRNARDQWMPDKSNPKQKIDAMVAVLMAFSECLFAEKEYDGPLFYSGST